MAETPIRAFERGMESQRLGFVEAGMTPEQVEQLMEPYRSFHAMMQDNEMEDAAWLAGYRHGLWMAQRWRDSKGQTPIPMPIDALMAWRRDN